MLNLDRTTHHWELINMGEIKVSTNPKELWDQFCDYFRFCDDHPILKKSTVKTGKGAGTKVVDELPRAYNIKALCLHCGIEEEWLRDIRNQKDKASEYYHVVSRALYIIYTQQYELAAVGELNPIFTSKALNMDKDEQVSGSVKVEIIGDLPRLSRSENEILEKLEDEMLD